MQEAIETRLETKTLTEEEKRALAEFNALGASIVQAGGSRRPLAKYYSHQSDEAKALIKKESQYYGLTRLIGI
jgi:hypothetical protein